MTKKIAFSLLAAAAMLPAAQAQILYSVDVTNSGGANQTATPTYTVDPSVTSTTLSRTTVTASAANNSFSSNNWNTTNTLNTGSNYISFSLTAASAPVTFGSIQFAINGSNTAPNTGTWAYTLDGGTTFTLGTTANGGAFTTLNAAPTALATWDFTDFTLATGSTVEFRFFEYGATSINGITSAASGTTRIANISGNDLVVNAGVVPEPTTFAAMGAAVGLLGLMIYRRNRKMA